MPSPIFFELLAGVCLLTANTLRLADRVQDAIRDAIK